MSISSKHDLQIVQAFSSLDVPERIIRDSNIKELINSIISENDSVESNAQRLERLRQKKKDGNFLSNFIDGVDGDIQSSQLDLNQSIGRLTKKSSQLLIVNTAISKVLSDQQRILLEQQHLLKKQTENLDEQNRKIFEQQKKLEEQQREINIANQGLMEAKGLTQKQAQDLVGSVKLVKEAEIRFDLANQTLRANVERNLHDSVEKCLARLNIGFDEQKRNQQAFEQQVTGAFSAQSQQTKTEIDRFASETSEFMSEVEKKLETHIQTFLEKAMSQDAANKQILETFSEHIKSFQRNMVVTVEEKELRLRDMVKGLEEKQQIDGHEHIQALEAQRELLEHKLQHLSDDLTGKVEARKHSDAQMMDLLVEQNKRININHISLALVACLALASLGWQVVLHFSLT